MAEATEGKGLPTQTVSEKTSMEARVESLSPKGDSSECGPVPAEVHELCRDMFEKTTEYLQGELVATSEEYSLLEKLNKMTTAKYSDMSALSKDLTVMMDELNGKYQNLQPYLDQIDQLDSTVGSLEQAAYQLDSYSKRLEQKLRQLDKR